MFFGGDNLRFLTIAAGVLSVAVAVFCFANQGVVFTAVAFVVGLTMMLCGACEIGSFFAVHHKMGHASYLLAEGATEVLLGVFVLSNCVDTESAVPVFCGMWSLFSGAIRAATALNSNLKRNDLSALWMLIVGVVSMAIGSYSFFNPVLFAVPNVMIVSICFLIQGVNLIATGIEMPKRISGEVRRENTLRPEREKKAKKKKETKEERERRERQERIEKRRQERAARKTMVLSEQALAQGAGDQEKLQDEKMENLFRDALFTAGDPQNGTKGPEENEPPQADENESKDKDQEKRENRES